MERQRRTVQLTEPLKAHGAPLLKELDAAFEEIRAEARRLIDEKWACVEAVAKQLYRKKLLDGDRVRGIVEAAEEGL
jgi:hypothetical protein